MTGAELSVLIVSWNCRELLEQCLQRLDAHAPAGRQTVVVDNGSTDGTVEALRAGHPEVEVIANGANLGYTRASNLGLRRCRGDFVLLLNADALVGEGSLEPMLELLHARPAAAAVGPRLVYRDGGFQRWTAGRLPGLRAAARHYLFLERLPLAGAASGLYLSRDVSEPFQPEWVSSACMLVRRSAVEAIGLMDESLFTYMDDVDLCARLRDAGHEVWYCPAATVIHLMGRDENRWRASVEALRSFNRYFVRRRGRAAAAALRGIEATGFALRVAAYSAAGWLRRRDPTYRAMARAHWTHMKTSLFES